MVALSDAGFIARKHSAGCGVASRLDHRAPALLRNHSRDNILAMRKKEQQLRGQHIIQSMKQPEPEFKLKQFSNVKSRLYDLPRPSPNSHEASEGRGRRAASERPSSRQSTSGAEVKHDDSKGVETDEKDVEIDMAAFELECERLKQLHGKKVAPRRFQKDADGCPAYLQRIKADIAQEQRLVEAQCKPPALPPGYREMPENERVKTLEALQAKREELEKAFRRLPFTIETAAQKRREQVVMTGIEETDTAIKKFSNSVVLVEA